jgi:hypothetical protein
LNEIINVSVAVNQFCFKRHLQYWNKPKSLPEMQLLMYSILNDSLMGALFDNTCNHKVALDNMCSLLTPMFRHKNT